MAGRIGDDKLTFRSGKVAVGHIDGYALFALGAEAVGKQGEINHFVAFPDAGPLNRLELILEDGFAIVQQPADQGTFPVINAAAVVKRNSSISR